MPKRRVCVHMTVHNNEPYVEEALGSVLLDPFPDFEILVFDDGSTDGTAGVVRRIAAADKRVRVEGSGQRLGVAKARAAMLELSDSDYILPFDGDDIFLPGRIARQVAALDARPEAAGVYGKGMMTQPDGSGNPLGFSMSPFYLPTSNPVCHGATLFRRAAALEVGGYLETGAGADSVGEDYFLWLRLVQRGGMFFENEFRYRYRCHGQQISKARAEVSNACHVHIRNHMLAANRGLAEQLLEAEDLRLRRDELPRAMLTLGLLCEGTEPRHPAHRRCLEIAARIAPDDYGVLLTRHRLLAALGDAAGALHQCELLLEKHPDDAFLRMSACRNMVALLRQIPDAPPEGMQAAEELYRHSPANQAPTSSAS